MTEITVVTYLCNQCGDKDHHKLFSNEAQVQPLNCMKCHAKDSCYIVPEETTKYNQVEFKPERRGHAKPEHPATA